MIQIVLYESIYQESIDKMMLEVAAEFDIPIFNQSSSTVRSGVDQYWIALDKNTVVGTIGIIKLQNKNAVLKRLFVNKAHRGEKLGVANKLLEELILWSKRNKINSVFLGTMLQFKRAQNFYRKNGFKQIDKNELPSDFIDNPIDDLYFKLKL